MRARAIAVAAAAATIAAGGAAVASIPDSGGVIHACVSKETKRIRLIEPGRAGRRGRCRSSETRLSWNQTGPRGATGATGLRGATGPAGARGTQGPPGSDGGPPPDPLLGSWALMFEGPGGADFAAPVHAVEGCRATLDVVHNTAEPFPSKNIVSPEFEGCTLELGLNLSNDLRDWIGEALTATFTPRTVLLVRSDASASYLRLVDTRVRTVTTPRLEGTAPAYLRVELAPARIERPAATPPQPPAGASLALHPVLPALSDIDFGGGKQPTRSIAPWAFSAVFSEETHPPIPPPELTVGDLAVRVAEPDGAGPAAFLTSFALEGNSAPDQERTVKLTLRDATEALTVELQHVGVFSGDLAPRADGTRAYRFYVERAVLSGP